MVKRALIAAAIVLSCAACGGGGSSSAPTPNKTLAPNPSSGLLKPAGKAQNTVNQLNQQQNQEQQQTGGSGYTP